MAAALADFDGDGAMLDGAMLDVDGAADGAVELDAVVLEPPQAVRLSRAAAATPATVKVVRLSDCISVLLDIWFLPISCLPQACRLPRDLFRLSGTCPWLVSHGVFGRSSGMDGWIGKDFSERGRFWRS
jgi:hypothetical protein